MRPQKDLTAVSTSFIYALVAVMIIALGATGIAALISPDNLSLSFVFGQQTWLVWLGTTALLLGIFGAAVIQLSKPAFGKRKAISRYRHC